MTTVLMADDSALLREGLVGLLERQGYEIVGQEHRADALLNTIAELAGRDALPDVVITDVRMPPTMTNDGLQAAIRIKEEHPRVAVLVLSQYVSPLHAQELFALPAPPGAGGAGYLLKDRVTDVVEFLDALERIASGGVVLDPEVVAQLLTRRSHDSRLAALSERERQVLALIAEGRSNQAIAEMLYLSAASIEKHVSAIFHKLDLHVDENSNRRVLAALAHVADERNKS